jgi:hypothetical protein
MLVHGASRDAEALGEVIRRKTALGLEQQGQEPSLAFAERVDGCSLHRRHFARFAD